MQVPWQAWALGSAGFAALTAVLAKTGLEGVAPAYATMVRTGVIMIVVIALWLAAGAPQAGALPPARATASLVLSGLATGLSWWCYMNALKTGEASRVAPVDKLSVVFVAVFAVVFLGEQLDFRGWTGVGLIAAGALLLALK
jgi:transporter family protein